MLVEVKARATTHFYFVTPLPGCYSFLYQQTIHQHKAYETLDMNELENIPEFIKTLYL